MRTFRRSLVLLLAATTLYAESFSGRVVGISDGDTIRVMHNGRAERVRLWGVDCPEKAQPFGTRARQFTGDLAFGKDVKVIGHDVDRYGRTVGEVILPDGRNLNHESAMVWRGGTSGTHPAITHWRHFKLRLGRPNVGCGLTGIPCHPGSGGGRQLCGDAARFDRIAPNRSRRPTGWEYFGFLSLVHEGGSLPYGAVASFATTLQMHSASRLKQADSGLEHVIHVQ